MKKLMLGLLLALASLSASADFILKNDTLQIILRDDAGCPYKVITDVVSPEFVGRLHPAEVTLNDGTQIKACWLKEEDQVFLVDTDLDGGTIPAEAFKPYRGV